MKIRGEIYQELYELERDKEQVFSIKELNKGEKASLLSDIMFKSMFQNDERIRYSCRLLSHLLDMEYKELLSKIKLVKNDVNKKYNTDKNERCDYVAEIDGSIINIEINNNSSVTTMERNLEYASRLYAKKTKVGTKYRYTQTIQFNINNFAFKGNEDIIDIYYMQNKRLIKLTSKIIIVNIYVPKLRQKYYNEGIDSLNELERCILALIEPNIKLSEELIMGDKVMEDYVKEAVEVCSEESFGESYDKEVALQEQARNDGYEEGLSAGVKKGLEEGIVNRSREIALSMLKENIDVNVIAKCTGLSIEEINDLNAE